MTKRMLIDAAHADETRVALLENELVYDYDFVSSSKTQIKGNIYLAKITRVEPSLQAAFVEYGGGKQGFLPFSEIHPDYYQLPHGDKAKLLEEQIAEAEAEEAAEEAAFEREQAARDARRGGREDGAEQEDDDFHNEEEQANRDDTTTDSDVVVAFTEASMGDSTELASMMPMPMVEMPESEPTHSPLQQVQPLNAESFAVHSDELPEEAGEAQDVSLSGEPSEEQAADQNGETTAEDGEETRRDNRSRSMQRRYRIQEVIKRNQVVLVQVIKEERGNKGASLTTFISLAGRAAVLMPNSPKGGGISRKITDRETRKRLKEVAAEMRTHRGMSVIIRTAGIDRTKAEIRRDYEYLVTVWNTVREQTLASTAPALIYEEGNLIKRSLRDLYTSDVEEIIVEGNDGYQEAKNFMKMLMPSHVGRVKLYKETMPLLSYAGVEDQLAAMSEPQVSLPSGGYLVIHPTEALISIDVNSGRSTSERNVEETAIKTNMEAAYEVARQLRLRDLAGLVVIDFIDMNYGKNRKAVERAMKDALKADRAKIQVGRISTFGLMELSRQRLRPSISESMGIMCPHCKGTGYIHSVETVGIQIIRTLEKEAAVGEYAILRVTTHPEAALYLLNEKRSAIQALEQRYNVRVVVLMDAAFITGHSKLVKVTTDGREIAHEPNNQPKRGSGTRGRRGRRGGRDGAGGGINFEGAAASDATESELAAYAQREDDDELIRGEPAGASEPREPRTPREPREPREPRGDRPRRERGGRNRNRGDRAPGERGDRPQGERRPRPERIEGEQPQVEGEIAIIDPITGESTVPVGDDANRERSRRRGRRGGRNRRGNGERGERAPGERGERRPREGQGSEASQESSPPSAEPTSYSSHSEHVKPAAYNAEPAPRAETPKPSRVIPLSEAQTNPAAIASPIVSESSAGDDKNKRKGWWSRVLEN